MENETKTNRSKEKFFDMRDREQSIEENPIRYGRQQYQNGFKDGQKDFAHRLQIMIDERRGWLATEDTEKHTSYQHMESLIDLLKSNLNLL